jgi:putative Holliday junction resolvase
MVRMNTLILLGFDFGMRYIGVSVGQTITKTARSLTTLTTHQDQPPWKEIDLLIQQWAPNALVVGLPIDMKEQETFITVAARDFATQLQQRFKLPVHLIDEKLSSREARAMLVEQGIKLDKENVDKMAAQLILQSWLNSNT